MNVSDQLLKILTDVGVKQVFGLTGDALNHFVDAIRQQDKVEWITVRHEETAGYAAYAQAALNGRLAVCAGTVGPGALHLINGLYNAKKERTPVLAITGQVPTVQQGTNYFQEVDLKKMFDDVCAYQAIIRSPEEAPRQVLRAIRIALAQGAVCRIELPADIAAMEAAGERYLGPVPVSDAVLVPGENSLRKAAASLDAGKRITILAGAGCRGAREEVLRLAERLKAPIVHTFRAADVFDHDTPGVVGLTGLIGDPPGYHAVMRADRLLMLGTDFPYDTFLPHGTETIQVDTRLENIGNRTPVQVGVHGDVKAAVTRLLDMVQERRDSDFRTALMHAFGKWKDQMLRDADPKEEHEPLHPQIFARIIGQKASNDAVFTIETGTSAIWAVRNISFHGDRRILGSFNHGSMGVGLPSAIGAQALYPEREVWGLVGDGSFTMGMQDFLTAVERKLPIKIIVFNNSELGFVKLEMEEAGLAPQYGALKQFNPDFADFARLCGGEGVRVEHARDIEAAVELAKRSTKPFIIDAVVSGGEVSFPPHISWKQVLGFGRSKIKEAALAVSGNAAQWKNLSEEIGTTIDRLD
jgi:thiamine pyrophosphate-dependent acetolactate synthase large subunit-like protein